MKKIMVMMVAMASAVIANAAAVDWMANVVEYADETTVDAGTFWLVSMGTATDTSAFKVYEDGTVDFGGASYTTGTIVDPFAVNGQITGLTESDNGSYYALVFWDGKNAADGGLFGVSDALAISGVVDAPPTNGDSLIFANGNDSYGSAMFANQSVAAIPEPTSGLLLLLGVAGLALRRKQK